MDRSILFEFCIYLVQLIVLVKPYNCSSLGIDNLVLEIRCAVEIEQLLLLQSPLVSVAAQNSISFTEADHPSALESH